MVHHELTIGNRKFTLDRTIIMGILNVTPDSFSDGGQFFTAEKAIARAKQMAEEGADIIDVGGESTRPYSNPITPDEELRRIAPVLEGIMDLGVPISVDTYRPEVARRALEMGACMINDVSGLRDKEMIKLVAEKDVPAVVMHMKGEPRNMQENPEYENVILEIIGFFEDRLRHARILGVKEEHLILDPGIGFGKKLEHNLEIIKNLHEFKFLGCPIMVGVSRKSFIGKILDLDAEERMEGSLGAMCAAIMHGVNIVRVHDVKESVRAARIVDAIKKVN